MYLIPSRLHSFGFLCTLSVGTPRCGSAITLWSGMSYIQNSQLPSEDKIVLLSIRFAAHLLFLRTAIVRLSATCILLSRFLTKPLILFLRASPKYFIFLHIPSTHFLTCSSDPFIWALSS